MDSSRESFTQLLRRSQAGDAEGVAVGELLPLIYEELRSLAERQLAQRDGRPAHTLQPTALVHEVWLRLGDDRIATVSDRAHFRALCARVMRRVLVEHARRRNADKRGGGAERVTIATANEPGTGADAGDKLLDLLALDDAIERLAELDARKAKVVDLRWFSGMSNAEIAETLDVGLRTVEADWYFARAWLRGELAKDD